MKFDYLVTSNSDSFLNEYTYSERSLMKALTNFDGSNGIAFLPKNKNNPAYFLTDGRYTLQAQKQLTKEYEWKVFNIVDTSLIDIINLISPQTIAFAGDLFSYKRISHLNGIFYIASDDVRNIYDIKKHNNKIKIYEYDIKYSGESFLSKLKRTQNLMKSDVALITDTSSVCWLSNLRAIDGEIPSSHMFNSYAMIHKNIDKIDIYCENEHEIIGEIDRHINIRNISELNIKDCNISIDSSSMNYNIYRRIEKNNKIIDSNFNILRLQARKNDTEIQGFLNAQEQDKIVLEKFSDWLKNTPDITELDVVAKIHDLRSKMPGFVCQSFDTIAGWNENGAIIHYKPTPESNKKIEGDGVLLVDSGGHYLGGTTDVTRTFLIGNVSDEIRYHHKLVEDANKVLNKAKFPIGVLGCQLDAIARQNLWNAGFDYQHGTGHGVGNFLSVHEGPFSISKRSLVPIYENHIMSIEPGLYLEGRYGIRIENLVYTKKVDENFMEFGRYE
jgi:Xaa-Pro aminopeptidase